MGLSNFAVTTGGGPGLLDFAALLTGNTAKQRASAKMQVFFDQAAPEIEEIRRISDPMEATARTGRLLLKGLAAGIPAQVLEKSFDPLIGAIRENVEVEKLQGLGRELSGGPEVVDKPTPGVDLRRGGGLLGSDIEGEAPDLSLPFSVETQPGREFSQSDVFTAFGPTIARKGLAGVAGLLKAPAEAESSMAEASKRKTERNLLQRKHQVLENLPEIEIPGGSGLTARNLGLATGGSGLTQLLPARERPKTELDIEEQKSRIERNRATAARLSELKKTVSQLKPPQLVQLRNSLTAQLRSAEGAFNEEEAEAIRAQIDLLDREIEKQARISFRPDKEEGTGQKSTGKPTAASVKSKFGIR